MLKIFSVIFFCTKLVTATSAENIVNDFNDPIVTSGNIVIPFMLDPINCGEYVEKFEGKILQKDRKHILYTKGMYNSIVLIIRNPVSKKTGFYHLERLFNMEGIAEVLNFYQGVNEPLDVTIIINQSHFDTTHGKTAFAREYGKSVDEYLNLLSTKFLECGVTPSIFRLTSIDISKRLKPYAPRFTIQSFEIPSEIGINAETGQIFWWSLNVTGYYNQQVLESFNKLVKQKGKIALLKKISEMEYSLADMCRETEEIH